MQVKKEQLSPTSVKLAVSADQKILGITKQLVIEKLGQNVKVPGFRAGKAPDHLIEKQIDASLIQSELLEQAINQLYVDAIKQEKLRPVVQPQITVTKFVPFSILEFTAEVEVVGDIKLANYKTIKLTPKKTEVTTKDVTGVLNNLRERGAAKQEVRRPAKTGDEVTIDFTGTDAKTKKPIAGADGKDYPLMLGSKTFIPGFEEELVGLKPAAKKTFDLIFPKDYGTPSLQNRKVTFAVTVKKVQELIKPKLDDAFAASIGSFKTVAELKADVKKQLKAERQRETQQVYDNELLEKIAAKSTLAIPPSLVDAEIDQMEEEEKRNVVYRGQTWQEHLDAEGLTEEAHREQKRETAQQRLKAGLVLGEIAEKEHITTTPEELEIRVQLLKGQYTDPAMQAELDKPENRRDINSRMLTEKTLDKLRSYATKP